MLFAKYFYVKNMLPKKLDDWSMIFTAGMCPAIIWLHDKFNRIHMHPYDGDTQDGVELLDWPSMYKVTKAIKILHEHAMETAINGINGLPDAGVTAIFYYAAFYLKHTCDLGFTRTGYSFSTRQRAIFTKALVIAEKAMEVDHKTRMRDNADILNTLVDTLADANTKRKLLKAGWRNHVANTFPYEEERTRR